MSQLRLSLIVWKLFMQAVSISFIYPRSSKFIFTKVTKCVVQSDSWLKKKWQVIFSHRNSDAKTKPGVSHEWIDPYLALKGVSIATFSLLKRSKSVYLTFNQRNSHYDIMATSVSLFSCHILTKKQKLYRSLAKISWCLTSIRYFTITDDLIMTSQ